MLNIVVSSSCEGQRAMETWISVTEGLAYFHCLNPILYAFLGVKFNQIARSMPVIIIIDSGSGSGGSGGSGGSWSQKATPCPQSLSLPAFCPVDRQSMLGVCGLYTLRRDLTKTNKQE
ncbi:hypothetical protein AMECASPLE_038008 [Ameca splendens]|uniref:Uncharacterized protein n=1 Tax=Ameca splendens TaxID=208324 RepID=A0ABV0Y8R1_9TELE